MEKYHITADDRNRVRPQVDKLKVSGDRIFATLQGEGATAGKKAIFLRLHFCNLACGKNGGWQCDTGYTWDKDRSEFWQEPEDWSYLETASKVKLLWSKEFGHNTPDNEKRIVITGGEPLLQQTKIIKLLEFISNWNVEIETNGTIKPDDKLKSCQINCSPKLTNSGNPLERRYNPEVLIAINDMPNPWFKFVVKSIEDLNEAQTIIQECHLRKDRILIMPEGVTLEDTTKHLHIIQEEVLQRGWRVTERKQLEWFGTKRRT